MNNLFQCETCKKLLMKEEVTTHTECDPHLKKFRTIKASSYYVSENDKGEVCLVIDGLNEIGYTFVIKKPSFVPIELCCDQETPNLNTKKNYDKTPTSDQNFLSKHLLFEDGKFFLNAKHRPTEQTTK
jgi:hypothetical protein